MCVFFFLPVVSAELDSSYTELERSHFRPLLFSLCGFSWALSVAVSKRNREMTWRNRMHLRACHHLSSSPYCVGVPCQGAWKFWGCEEKISLMDYDFWKKVWWWRICTKHMLELLAFDLLSLPTHHVCNKESFSLESAELRWLVYWSCEAQVPFVLDLRVHLCWFCFWSQIFVVVVAVHSQHTVANMIALHLQLEYFIKLFAEQPVNI